MGMLPSASEVRTIQSAVPASDLTPECEALIQAAIDNALETGAPEAQVTLPAGQFYNCISALRTLGYRIVAIETSVLNPGAERIVRFSW